jgi:nucleotide-binding universal stress UspA family protein
MRPRFIVGYDGSPAARDAMRFMRRLAELLDAELIAAYVYPTPGIVYADPYGGIQQSAFEDSVKAAERAAIALLDEAHGADRVRPLPGGSVPGERHALAVGEDAVLLAVGSTHRGAAGRLVPGSVGERLVHGSPCPVLVVPPGAYDQPLDTVGVAYDGRVEARRALRLAAGLAERLRASLTVMAAVKPGPRDGYMPRDPVVLDQSMGSPYGHALEDAAARVGNRVQVTTRLLLGPAGPALAGTCVAGVDILVAGSRGYGPLHAAATGSTSRHLADHTPCPVVIVPWGVHSRTVHAFETTQEVAGPA